MNVVAILLNDYHFFSLWNTLYQRTNTYRSTHTQQNVIVFSLVRIN